MTDQNSTKVGGLWKNKGKGWKGKVDWTAMDEAKAKGHDAMNVFENGHKVAGDKQPDYNMIMYPKFEGINNPPASLPPVAQAQPVQSNEVRRLPSNYLEDDIPF